MKKHPLISLSFTAVFALLMGISGSYAQQPYFVLASTTSVENSGLLAHILPLFTGESGVSVRVVALGTGQALDTARRGDADLVLVHDPEAERQFIEASSLLTVLRGLERWSGEVRQGVEALAAAVDAQVLAAQSARNAAEDAARGATTQLDAANRAMERVTLAARDLEKVHEESRFAALESAHAALTAWSPGAERLAEALTTLIRVTQAAQERARELELATRSDLASAHEQFGALRARLDAEPVRPADDSARELPRRALDRVHEMVRDAIARGERLVQQAERTSSEAQKAGEGVNAAVEEVEGLHARFGDAPVEEVPPREEAPARPLRVLGPEDLLPDDENWSHG